MSTSHQVQRMTRTVIRRVKPWNQGSLDRFYIDFRLKGLRGDRVTVRDPEAPGWPEDGEPARTLDQALEWAEEYPRRLGVSWCTGTEELETVAQVGEALVKHMEETKESGVGGGDRRAHLPQAPMSWTSNGRLGESGSGKTQSMVRS